MVTDPKILKMSRNAPPVGCYNLMGGNDKTNSVQFIFNEKPSWWHRMCTKFFLGWTWIDD